MLALAHSTPYLYGFRSKWKSAEQGALSSMPSNWQDLTLPLVNLPPPREYDPQTGRILSQDEYIRRFGPRLAECWGKREILVDAQLVPDEVGEGRPDHPLVALFQRARSAGAAPIPMTGLNRPARYQDAVRRVVALDNRGAALRIELMDLAKPTFRDQVERFLVEQNLPAGEVYAIVDLGSRPMLDLSFAPLIGEKLANFPFAMNWRELFLSVTTLPDDFRLNTETTKELPRLDWDFYQEVLASAPLPRVPVYADYSIEQARMLGQKGPMRCSLQLRSSTHSKWILSKGKAMKVAKHAGIQVPAKAIVERADFRGAGFSSGDADMKRWSEGVAPFGDPVAWRRAGHEHHFALVFEKLGVPRTAKTSAVARQLDLWPDPKA